MSRFLAPIHTWVFNKIKIHEDLEENLVASLGRKFGDEIVPIVKKGREQYGDTLGDKPIEEVIDTGNIHGWLQGRIDTVETRLALILTEAVKSFGQEARDVAYEVYRNNGRDYGTLSRDSHPVATAPELYKALNNYLLEGMPCDLVNIVKVNEAEKLQWNNIRCLHVGYWEEVNAEVEMMYDLRYTWIRSFIEAANEAYTFRISKPGNSEAVFINEIVTM